VSARLIRIHDWFDESKMIIADFRHRALRHHAEGIFMAETIFGSTITLSTGRVIPVRCRRLRVSKWLAGIRAHFRPFFFLIESVGS
jgi:hypothetical protein